MNSSIISLSSNFQIVSKHNNFVKSPCSVTHRQANKQEKPPTSHLSSTSETTSKMQSSFQTSLSYDPVRDTLRRVPPRPGQGGMNYQGTSTNIGRYSQAAGVIPELSRQRSGFEKILRARWREQGNGQPSYLCEYCQADFRTVQQRNHHEKFVHGINYAYYEATYV